MTKAQQMGRTGPQLPLKKCAVIITTFLGTKPLCSHDYARLQVQWRPSMPFYGSRTHTVAAFRSPTVLPGSFSSLSVLPPPCLSLRGYLHTFHPMQTVFVGGLVGNGKPTPRQSIVFTHLLSKAFVNSVSSESHSLSLPARLWSGGYFQRIR